MAWGDSSPQSSSGVGAGLCPGPQLCPHEWATAPNDLRPVSGCTTPPQVFEEEHHVLYLDHGGVIVAIKDTSIPLKILK